MSEITAQPAAKASGLGGGLLGRLDGVLLTLLAGAVVLWFLPVGMGRYGTYVLTLWLVTAIAVMGLNLTLGIAGLKSLAQGAFMGSAPISPPFLARSLASTGTPASPSRASPASPSACSSAFRRSG